MNTAVKAVSPGRSAAVIAEFGMDVFERMSLEEVMRNGVKIAEKGFIIIIVTTR